MPDEVPESREEKPGFIDKILDMDHRTATKWLIVGMIVAICFGTIALTSRSIDTNAASWADHQDELNELAYWRGDYGYQEYLERQREIDAMEDLMNTQDAYITIPARIGVNIGLLMVLIAFIAYTADNEMTKEMRLLSLILAGVVVTVMMFTMMFTNINVNIA